MAVDSMASWMTPRIVWGFITRGGDDYEKLYLLSEILTKIKNILTHLWPMKHVRMMKKLGSKISLDCPFNSKSLLTWSDQFLVCEPFGASAAPPVLVGFSICKSCRRTKEVHNKKGTKNVISFCLLFLRPLHLILKQLSLTTI